MSTSQYLHGSYVIPSKEWAKLKKEIFSAWNSKRDALQLVGDSIYSKFKGKKLSAMRENHADEIMSLASTFTRKYSSIAGYCEYDFLNVVYNTSSKAKKVCKPTVKSMDHYMAKAKSTTTCLHELNSEFSINLCNKTRTISISIEENNRNVNDFFGMNDDYKRRLLRAIKNVTWGRGSGGSMTTWSETYDDDSHERYDKSYSYEFGPIGKADSENRRKFIESQLDAYRRMM